MMIKNIQTSILLTLFKIQKETKDTGEKKKNLHTVYHCHNKEPKHEVAWEPCGVAHVGTLHSHLRSDSYTSLIQHPDGVLVPVAHLAQDVFLRHLEDRPKQCHLHTHTCLQGQSRR